MLLFQNADDVGFEALVAENDFITEVHLAIEAALDSKGVSQADLANLLDVSEARVSQIMSGNGKNLQARTIARIAYALGMKPELKFFAEARSGADRIKSSKTDWLQSLSNARFSHWRVDGPANDHWAEGEVTESIAVCAVG